MISHSGEVYTVNALGEVCDCPDHQHSHWICKHIRRARSALGIDELSAAQLREFDIADNFAAHCHGPIVLASDGGRIGDTNEPNEEVTGLDTPDRSEKADFGGGESTGIQEL